VVALLSCEAQTLERKKTPTDVELIAFGLGGGSFILPKSLKMKKVNVIIEPTDDQKKIIYLECYNAQLADYTSLVNAFAPVVKNDAFAPVSYNFDQGFKYIATYDYVEKNEKYNVYIIFCQLEHEENNVKYDEDSLILTIELDDEDYGDTIPAYTLFSRAVKPNDHELSNIGLVPDEISYFDEEIEAVDVNSTSIKNQSKLTLIFKNSSEESFDEITESYYNNFANRRDGYLTDKKEVVLFDNDDQLLFRADYFRNKKGFQCEIIYYSEDTIIADKLLIPEKTLSVRFSEISDYVTHEYYYRKNISTSYKITELPAGADWATPGLVININTSNIFGVKHTPNNADGDKYYLEIAIQNATSSIFVQTVAGLNSKMSFVNQDGNKVNLNTLIENGEFFDVFTAYYVFEYYRFKTEIAFYKEETSDASYLYPKSTMIITFTEL
jgi:hypothetical protein